MATNHPTSIRNGTDELDTRTVLLLAAYGGTLLATAGGATVAALALAGFATDMVGFVLLAGGWLAAVGVSPEVARRVTAGLAAMNPAKYAPRSARAVDAVVTYLLAR